MQTIAQVKEEIYSRMSVIAEPRAKYIPGANKRVDALIAELRQITSKRQAGKPMPEELAPQYSKILTELSNVYGISGSELSRITGMDRKAIARYIKPQVGQTRFFDEIRLENLESKELLLTELDQIMARKVPGKSGFLNIRDDDKPRLSEVLTKLHIAHGLTINWLSDRTKMDRNVLAGYIHVYTGIEIKRHKQFTPGPDPAKKVWWKKSGKKYKEMWQFAQDITGITPVKTKDNYRDIGVEAVNYVNANEDHIEQGKKIFGVKNQLLDFIKHYSYNSMYSADGYAPQVQIPIAFIQWLSERKGHEITFNNLEFESEEYPDGILLSVSDMFADDYSPSHAYSSQALVRSQLKKLFDWLSDVVGKIHKNPFGAIKIKMNPSTKQATEDVGDVIVYNNADLDEFFDKIIARKAGYYPLFLRLILQTGVRPGQMMGIKCKDIGGQPVIDALDRKFYLISTGKILSDEKKKLGEQITKKFAPGKAYISEDLKIDLEKWCVANKLSSDDYIIQKFILTENAIQGGIHYTAYSLGGYRMVNKVPVKDSTVPNILKHEPDYYHLYGMRHTWSSIVFNITESTKYVQEAGGWQSTSSVSADVYQQLMSEKGGRPEALRVAKKWGIYIHPQWKNKVAEIEQMGKEKAVTPAMGAEQLKQLEEVQKGLIEQLTAMRKEIEALKGKK